MPATVILVRPIPDNRTLFQSTYNLPDIVPFDRRVEVPLPTSRHDCFQQLVLVAAVHDIERSLAGQDGTAEIQRREMHPEQEYTSAFSFSCPEVFEPLDIHQRAISCRFLEPGHGGFDNGDTTRSEILDQHPLPSLNIGVREAEREVSQNDMAPFSREVKGEQPQCRAERPPGAQRQHADEPDQPDADPGGPVPRFQEFRLSEGRRIHGGHVSLFLSENSTLRWLFPGNLISR